METLDSTVGEESDRRTTKQCEQDRQNSQDTVSTNLLYVQPRILSCVLCLRKRSRNERIPNELVSFIAIFSTLYNMVVNVLMCVYLQPILYRCGLSFLLQDVYAISYFSKI